MSSTIPNIYSASLITNKIRVLKDFKLKTVSGYRFSTLKWLKAIFKLTKYELENNCIGRFSPDHGLYRILSDHELKKDEIYTKFDLAIICLDKEFCLIDLETNKIKHCVITFNACEKWDLAFEETK